PVRRAFPLPQGGRPPRLCRDRHPARRERLDRRALGRAAGSARPRDHQEPERNVLMPKLEDGSEFGLKGHFREDFSHRTRIGLAPRAGHVDRDAPYKRIATEEAWTFPALVKAQVDYLESGDAPADDSLRMGAM